MLSTAYWHALNIMFASELWKVLPVCERLGGPERLFKEDENRILGAGLDPSSTSKIISNRGKVNPAMEWDKLQDKNISAFSMDEPEYPLQLKEIPSPPPIIYVRGDIKLLTQKMIGVVGSRKITGYGKDVIRLLVPDLGNFGIGVVSGAAHGVDSEALECCMDSGGSGVGVLASSLDWHEIGPRSNLRMLQRILERGCLVSENPPGRIPHKMYFPLRNRIISGLSIGVLVIEAAKESGSLITARCALEHNREVFAVPGSIFSGNSEGTLDLIKAGAKCTTNFYDIAQEFGWDSSPVQKTVVFDNKCKHLIIEALSTAPLNVSDLANATKIPAGQLMAELTELEISGIIRRSAEGLYAKIK